jgi:metallo-beta-lactamase class B
MRPNTLFVLVTVMLAATLSPVIAAQRQEDLERQHFDAAAKAAGSEWMTAAKYFAMTVEEVKPTLPSSGVVPTEPAKAFDNLYLIGSRQVVVWAIRTTNGIVLIDAGGTALGADALIAQMKQLGLDPRDIRYVLITHGHSDHYGGARALQDRFGVRVGMSAADWDVIQPKPGGPPDADVPKRDLTLVDGEAVDVGDVRLTPVLIPGHTPGSMGFVFNNVKDGANTHVAALFGGTMLSPAAPLPQVQQYLGSIEHFQEVTRRLGADVELLNHPLMDDLFARLERLKTRNARDAHPLVVGRDAYQRFLTVMYESMKGQLARRGELNVR